jgi:hypothetical protein
LGTFLEILKTLDNDKTKPKAQHINFLDINIRFPGLLEVILEFVNDKYSASLGEKKLSHLTEGLNAESQRENQPEKFSISLLEKLLEWKKELTTKNGERKSIPELTNAQSDYFISNFLPRGDELNDEITKMKYNYFFGKLLTGKFKVGKIQK